MPKWVREAYDDYIARLGSGLKVALTQIEPGSRSGGRTPRSAIQTEGQRLLAALRKDDYVVALDERGSTRFTALKISAAVGWLLCSIKNAITA